MEWLRLCRPVEATLEERTFPWTGEEQALSTEEISESRSAKNMGQLGYSCSAVGECAAKAFYSCPAIISRHPESQNTPKESQLNPEEECYVAAWLNMVRRGSVWCGVAQYGAAWLSW